MRRILLALLALLLFAGCGSKTGVTESPRVSFEVKELDLQYHKKPFRPFGWEQKGYYGTGIIMAVGEPAFVRQPYIVMIKITRIKGGLKTATNKERLDFIPVINGIGKFETNDTTITDEKIEKPEYNVYVVGYKTVIPASK